MTYVAISILAIAAFLNAAALGEQYALKRASLGTAVYRFVVFAIDMVLILFLFRSV